MKERPIIFSGDMVQAILDGRKTMTRRPVKPQPSKDFDYCRVVQVGKWFHIEADKPETVMHTVVCPYGQPGDRLWVRETFVIEDDYEYIDGSHTPLIDRPIKTLKDTEGCEYHLIPHYRATEPEPNIVPYALDDPFDDRTRWKSPFFMPRWASRITLEIVSVRVERLQEIEIGDIGKEGIVLTPHKTGSWQEPAPEDYYFAFADYWNSLYTKKPELQWEASPWVWVVEFKH